MEKQLRSHFDVNGITTALPLPSLEYQLEKSGTKPVYKHHDTDNNVAPGLGSEQLLNSDVISRK